MLKLGEQNVKGLYLGEQEIKKAYLGDELVFSVANPSRLPDGYTEVQYIETSTYTNIPVKGVSVKNNTTRIVMDVMPKEKISYKRDLFMALNQPSNVAYGIRLGQNNVANQMFSYAGWTSSNSEYGFSVFNYNLAKDVRITIDFDTQNKYVIVNGTKFSIVVAPQTNNAGILSVGSKTGSTSSYAALSAWVYSIKVYVDGILKADLVPCVNSNKNPGLFNLITDTFCGKSYGNVIAGPAV